jgi:hypothetical protein
VAVSVEPFIRDTTGGRLLTDGVRVGTHARVGSRGRRIRCGPPVIPRGAGSILAHGTLGLDDAMSQKTVQWLIGRLITDEEVRLQFLEDPVGLLNRLRDEGFPLTNTEITALVETDRDVWSDAAARVDVRLQRSSLRTD